MKEKIRKLFTNVWTIPNVLTMLRLILVPVFVAASLTDMLDGFLARKLNQITDFGKLFDPLADKLMVVTALFCQGIAGVFPWAAVFIVLAKELFMMAGSVFMLKKGVVVYANYFGKAATVCFIASLILSFFHQELAAWGWPLDQYLLWIAVAAAVLAMISYTVQSWKQIQKMKETGQNSVESVPVSEKTGSR